MSMMRGQGFGRGDELGTWAPIGGSGGEKELIRLPSDAEKLAPVAGTLLRSRISEKLRGYYGLAASFAGDHKPTQAFIIYMSAAGLGVSGFARNEYLMGLARMPVPSAMPVYQLGGDGQGKRTGGFAGQKKDKKEEED